MATRLTNDTYDFRQGIGYKLPQLISTVVMSPCGFAVAFYQDWRLTLMMLGAVPIMGIAFAIAMKVMTKAAANQQEFYSKAGGVAETAIGAVRTVAAFNGYERETQRYDALLSAAERQGSRSGWQAGMAQGFAQCTIYCTFSLGFFLGSLLVVNDFNNGCWKSDPPFGTCFTGATMLSTLFAVLYGGIGLGAAAPGFAVLSTARSACGRIYAIIDEPPAFDAEAGSKLDVVQGNIDFANLTFAYPTAPDRLVLNNVTMSVPKGKTAAFVGPSGSGKSTVIALLQRFYDPLSGSVSLDGHDIRSLSLTWLRSRIALVQQEPVLFSGTIYSNINYGLKDATREQIEAAAKAANAHDFISDFPARYSTECGERGLQLSGGQKQRIAIARAIVRDPSVLLLDEATSALDNESEKIVQKAIDDMLAQSHCTTLVIAHRLSTIQDADIIFVLENGVLLDQGSHKELMEKKGSLYAQLVELQAVVGQDVGPAEMKRQLSGRSGGPEPLPILERSRSARSMSGGNTIMRTISGMSIGSPAAAIADPAAMESSRVHENGDEAADKDGLPAEDDAEIPIPTSRLWGLQRDNMCLIVVALIATVPTAVARPFMGFLFSDVSNLFSQPPAVKIMGQWVPIMDTEHVRVSTSKSCLEFAILGVVMLFGTTCMNGGFRQSSEALTRKLRYLTFKAMLRQEVSWFDARTSGQLADRLASEAPLIKSFTGESLAAIIQLSLTVATGLGLAFYYSWRLTLTTMVFLPLLAVGNTVLMKSMKIKTESEAGPMISEAMGNIKTVAAFGLREQLLQKYTALMEAEGQVELRKSSSVAVSSAFTNGVSFLMFGGVVAIANIFISNALIEPSVVLKVLFPIMFCASGAAMASQWKGDQAKGQKAVNHIFNTIDRTPEIDAYSEDGLRLESTHGKIEYRHVRFVYPTRPDKVIFTDFDLTVEPGSTVAFVGPSGSGKSTTINLLQRFYTPTGGTVLLDGHDIQKLNIQWLREQMAYVQQEPILFGGTILENIRYGNPAATDAECKQAAESANALEFISNLPEQWESDVGERGSKLSGGQKQRIAIARSLVRKPAVLLLDEATSALDSQSERVVQEALDRLLRESKRTTLVVAHRLSTIQNADMICFIYEGKIIEKGRHEELMKIKGGQYKMLASRQEKVVAK
eukprot:TRINITY_DN23208_c0_g1_i1.p1 TRINITY_DN23208_c0_g1~~TRINITY_DN23208_c0_g1_i1.p1  ORF type:complete len:1359 (-),score=209.49 TRINITY_DN23208_c0_g1_i1:175-3651(-)